jgi:hypothetical protein
MGIGFDFSAYFVRDPQHLVRVMSTNPSYLRTAHDAEVRNLRDWGIPLGRGFRALKAFFHLVDEGAAGSARASAGIWRTPAGSRPRSTRRRGGSGSRRSRCSSSACATSLRRTSTTRRGSPRTTSRSPRA